MFDWRHGAKSEGTTRYVVCKADAEQYLSDRMFIRKFHAWLSTAIVMDRDVRECFGLRERAVLTADQLICNAQAWFISNQKA